MDRSIFVETIDSSSVAFPSLRDINVYHFVITAAGVSEGKRFESSDIPHRTLASNAVHYAIKLAEDLL